MFRLHPAGASYLFFLICTLILAIGYALVLYVVAYVNLLVAVFFTLSQGVGYG